LPCAGTFALLMDHACADDQQSGMPASCNGVPHLILHDASSSASAQICFGAIEQVFRQPHPHLATESWNKCRAWPLLFVHQPMEWPGWNLETARSPNDALPCLTVTQAHRDGSAWAIHGSSVPSICREERQPTGLRKQTQASHCRHGHNFRQLAFYLWQGFVALKIEQYLVLPSPLASKLS